MLLALVFLLGIAYARRALALPGWAEAVTVGLALAQALMILPTNAVLRMAGWQAWPAALAAFFVVLGLLVLAARGPACGCSTRARSPRRSGSTRR